jgi:CBS domain-containing protein
MVRLLDFPQGRMERTSQLGPALVTPQGLEASRIGEELTTPIGSLVSKELVAVRPEASVAETAWAMRDANASAAVVTDEPPGIVTHRDLAERVLAAGLDLGTPVGAVMSRPLEPFPASTPVFEALRRMLELGVHHLPVTRGKQVVAILRDTDLLRHQLRSPLPLLDRIEALRALAETPPDYSREVAGIAETLFSGGLGVAQIGGVLAAVSDALTRRLLTLAERELGPPPCPYAWIVLGSEGRREQVLLSDQDSALVYMKDVADASAYFHSLAELVVDALIKAGFPRCPGDYMATRWCKPLAEWEAVFAQWVEVPEPQALLEAQIFLDFRAVHGGLSLEPLDLILAAGGRRALFLHNLAQAVLRFRPPVGRLGRIRTADGQIDLKVGGIGAIVMLARLYALAARASPRPTLERLEAAARAGTLSRAGAEILGESFRFLTRLRLQEQMRSFRSGEEPSNRVRPEELSPLERRRLVEALRAVRKQQEAAALRFPG